MRKRAFHILSALSAIVCLVIGYLAAVMTASFDETPYAYKNPGWYFQYAEQKFEIVKVQILEPSPGAAAPTGFQKIGYRQTSLGNIFPDHPKRGSFIERWYMSVWLLIALAAVLPALWIARCFFLRGSRRGFPITDEGAQVGNVSVLKEDAARHE
jgi:hypothetical protein